MLLERSRLAPHMAEYTERLYENGDVRWLPYVMYFQPTKHESATVRTDRLGFRPTWGGENEPPASPGGRMPAGPVRILVGNSVAFGVGASSDRATLPSRLWSRHAPARPWVNFGGRSHNSAQELINFLLHRHLVPEIDEIVVFSGYNDMQLARLPQAQQGEHGAFFLCTEYYAKIEELRKKKRRKSADRDGSARPPVPEQIAHAAELTVRHLESWRVLATGLGVRLSFVLQPVASWVRGRPAQQEKLLFDELESHFKYSQVYGDIMPMEVGQEYARVLQTGCEKLSVPFLDMNPLLGDSVDADEWLFIDRAHLTDNGYDVVARLLANWLDLS